MIQKRFQNQRKSIRLGNYDYSSTGAYFVTICTQTRANWFGEITREGMQLNEAGYMILKTWNELPNRFEIELDAFIIMPDHIHGIIWINPNQPVGATLVVALPQNDDKQNTSQNYDITVELHHVNNQIGVLDLNVNPTLHGDTTNAALHRETTRVSPTDDGVSLFDVVGAFKSLTTNAYIHGVRQFGWQPFEKRLWERSFHDSIIRDEVHFEKTRKYILGNPHRWLETRGML